MWKCTFRNMSTRAGLAPASYVFVKQKGKRDMQPKKVLLPSSLVAFKKAATKALGGSRAIASFMAENGRIITNVHDLMPNMTVFAVYEAAADQASTTSETKHAGIRLQVSQPVIKNQSSVTQIAVTPQSKKGNVPSQTSTPSIVLSVKKSPNVMQGSQTKSVTPRGSRPTTPTSGRPPLPNQAALTPTVDNDSTDYDDDENSSYSEPEMPLERNEGGVEESEGQIRENQGDKIMEVVIPVNEMRQDVLDAFAMIEPESQDLLADALALEETHQERYFHSILKTLEDSNMFPETEEIECENELRARAREIIDKHRTVSASGVSYHFKTAVVGPRQSGKTTFLRILLQELLKDVIATDSWKKTFVFPVDMAEIIHTEPTVIFKRWIAYVFAQFRAQLPSMLEYLPCIESAFAGLMDTKGTAVLPRKLTQVLELRKLSQELQSILSNMAANWYNSAALVPWWTSVLMLPNLLASAFGFTTIINICDHFDETSMEIQPSYPFEGSPHVAFLSEIWKCCVNQGSCIFGARNTPEFMRLLDSLETFSFDMSNYLDYHNLYDVAQTVKYQDKEIVVEFNENHELLKIYSSICAGVPSYLTKWYALNTEIDELDELDSKSIEYEEKLCYVITRVETLLSMLYLSPLQQDAYGDEIPGSTNPLDHLSVADVRRRSVK